MNNLILKKLIFTGSGKSSAVVEFKAGFNVISGPSDTGKSLIFECLNYVLGGSGQPKEPPEAKGYTNLFLTLNAGEQKFTIERSVLSNDVRVYEDEYDNIDDDTPCKELSASANARDNLSDYLLKIVGIEGKKLKKNERNETVSLTFNVLRNLILIDEGRIQKNTSPILTDNPTSATPEKTLFRFLLTGIDYSNVIVHQKPEIRKADANARINLLNHLIENSSLNIKKDATHDELEEQLQRLEEKIEAEITKISENHSEIERLQQERKDLWNKIIIADSKVDHFDEILSRFTLLQQHYQTDLDRLDAIIETGSILSHADKSNCPLCGADPSHHQPECVISENEISSIKASCEFEKNKIHSLQTDLNNTIVQVMAERDEYREEKKQSDKRYKEIDVLLKEKLGPSITVLKRQLHEFFSTQKDIEIMISMVDQIKEMEELKVSAEDDLKPQPKPKKIPAGVQAAEVTDLLKVIEETLRDWKYPELGRVGFSEDQQDITIGNKNRADQGKGYRAITHAAFIISLMEYCVSNNKPHPGFVVLDSPLVTFRGTDNPDEGETISDDMKQYFYTELSKTAKDRQIIIIENDDPPDEIISDLNFIHFTKDVRRGRYGFIPQT
jgi:hypothetical protein